MSSPSSRSDTPVSDVSRKRRLVYFILGWVMVALGFIGAMLPLMPTTVFLAMAAWCFGRSSPRFEAWLLNHPRFGGPLRAWRAHGAVPHKAKIAACTGMTVGYLIFLFTARPVWWLAILVGVIMGAACWWMATRPTPDQFADPDNPESRAPSH